MSKKIQKTFSLLASLAMALTVGQLVVPAAQASGDTIYVHAACSPWWSHNVATTDAEVINVSPGDTVNFTSVYQRDGHLCDTVSWNADRDLSTVFDPGPPDLDSPIPASYDLHISASAQPGIYQSEIFIYQADGFWGTSYKFLVTPTKIQSINTFDCYHNDVVPTEVYVNSDPDTFYSQTITGGCDSSKGYGNMYKGASLYDQNGAALGTPFFWNGSWGPGYSYSYYRGHTEQGFFVVVPSSAETLAATEVTATSLQLNGSVTDNGIKMASGLSTTSEIYFCMSESPEESGGQLNSCDIADGAGSPARTDSTGAPGGAGDLTQITTTSSYNVTGLNTGTTYYYQVRGINGAGVATFGAIQSIVPQDARSAQELTWDLYPYLNVPPSGSVRFGALPSTLDDADLTYSVVYDEDTESDCSIADPTQPVVSVSTIGTCKVRVTSLPTASHLSATLDLILVFNKAGQQVLWNVGPTSIEVPSSHTYTVPESATEILNNATADIRYTVVYATSDCALVNDTAPVVTVSTSGICQIRARVPGNQFLGTAYSDAYLTFTRSLIPQEITWNPNLQLSLSLTGSVQIRNFPSTLNDADITFEVINDEDTTTDCSIANAYSAVVSVTTAGDCKIRATALEYDGYSSTYVDMIFRFAKSQSSIVWAPTVDDSVPSNGIYEISTTAQEAVNGVNNLIHYTVVGGTSDCSIDDDSVPALDITTGGTCIVRASVDATDVYQAAQKDVTFTFAPTAAPQVITWNPTLNVVIPATGIVHDATAPSGLGSPTLTYEVVAGSNTTSNCLIADSTSRDITVSTAGTCAVRVNAAATANYGTASIVVIFTFTIDANADVAPAEGDGTLAPKAVGSTGKFIATNDPTFLLSWDKKTGKLISQATGIYIGYIEAKITFTKSGKVYTCTAQFGITKAMPGKTAAQKAAAMKSKVFTGKQFCIDKTKLDPKTIAPKGGMTKANFAKIKPMNKTAAELKQEKAALTALKGFTGQVQIQVIRYRGWPTTMWNYGDFTGKGGKIPSAIRNTKVNLG